MEKQDLADGIYCCGSTVYEIKDKEFVDALEVEEIRKEDYIVRRLDVSKKKMHFPRIYRPVENAPESLYDLSTDDLVALLKGQGFIIHKSLIYSTLEYLTLRSKSKKRFRRDDILLPWEKKK